MSGRQRQLMTPREVGLQLGVSKTTATTWAESGVLPAVRIGSRWYFQRPRLVAAGWLPPDYGSATNAATASNDHADGG